MNDNIADPIIIANCILMSMNIVKLYMYFDAASDIMNADIKDVLYFSSLSYQLRKLS